MVGLMMEGRGMLIASRCHWISIAGEGIVILGTGEGSVL